MLELKQIEVDEFFKDMLTIQQLQELTHPTLAYGTIINAINKGKVVCKKFGGDTEQGGIWLVSLKSAQCIWPDRFERKTK